MIRKSLLLKVFDAACMRRWNDQIRPVDLRELDKQAHKMIIVFILANFENKNSINWVTIIENGIFELFQRIVVTDLKPQLFHRIKVDAKPYKKLNEYVYEKLEPIITQLDYHFDNHPDYLFSKRFREHFKEEDKSINMKLLNASHYLATKWEFRIIRHATPEKMGFDISQTEENIAKRLDSFDDLPSIKKYHSDSNLEALINVCGQLRFQIRWSQLDRIPRTSVLGHMLIVAIFSYFFSRAISASDKRCVNNFFTGLFHDLPEVFTRDVIDPVKRIDNTIDGIIKDYEENEMEKRVYKQIPTLRTHLEMFTKREFSNIVVDKNGKESHIDTYLPTEDEKENKMNINDFYSRYNNDTILRDGKIVEAADKFCAFIEAYLAIRNGMYSPILEKAKLELERIYSALQINDLDFRKLYADFD